VKSAEKLAKIVEDKVVSYGYHDKFENEEREVVLNKSKRINVFVNRSVSESYLQDRLSDGFKYLSITTQTYCR